MYIRASSLPQDKEIQVFVPWLPYRLQQLPLHTTSPLIRMLQYFESLLGKLGGDPQCSPCVSRANTMATVSPKSQQLGKLLNETQQAPAGQTQQFKCTCLNQPATTEKAELSTNSGSP